MLTDPGFIKPTTPSIRKPFNTLRPGVLDMLKGKKKTKHHKRKPLSPFRICLSLPILMNKVFHHKNRTDYLYAKQWLCKSLLLTSSSWPYKNVGLKIFCIKVAVYFFSDQELYHYSILHFIANHKSMHRGFRRVWFIALLCNKRKKVTNPDFADTLPCPYRSRDALGLFH